MGEGVQEEACGSNAKISRKTMAKMTLKQTILDELVIASNELSDLSDPHDQEILAERIATATMDFVINNLPELL